MVLSNDSFQEFHEEYPWLFDASRLIGGKPVKGVGWVFTPRIPVRGAKSVRAAKKLSATLPGGTKPTIGTTLTPVKTVKAPAKVAKKAAKATEPAKHSSPRRGPPKRPPRSSKPSPNTCNRPPRRPRRRSSRPRRRP